MKIGNWKLKITKKSFFVTILVLLIGGGLLYWKTAFGVTRTWDGGGTDGTCGGAGTANNWTCAANWSADTAPTASDIATFDATSTKDATINANISVAGINIAAGYSGTITQSSTYTVTVGTSHYVQAAGTFTGGSGTIDINGTFTLSAGTFTSTSGILEVGRNSCGETFFTISGGAFNHNNGTVKFVANGGGFCDATNNTIDVVSILTLYDIELNATGGDSGTNYFTPGSGDTIIAANNFTHTNGKVLGTWEVQGNITIASTADGGDGTLTMTGTGSKTYTYTAGGIGSHLRINNASITVSANGGTTDLHVSLFSLLVGTFIAPSGTLTVGRSSGSETFFTISGGTFNHNNGTVKFAANGGGFFDGTTKTIDVASTLTLYDIELNAIGGDVGTNYFSPGSGDTIIAAHNFTLTNGRPIGTWEVQGNYTVATTADGGTAGITFTGGNTQTYTDQGGNEPDGNITINKSVGSVLNLASNADWNAASQTTTITSGILNLGAYNLYTGGTLTVGANGVLHDYSTGDLILGGTVSNSGVIRLESSGSCGSTDAISITSSSNGVQRAWSGSGVYTLWDTSIQDQGGTAKIQVNSGTSVSGNGTNFVFNSACNFASNTPSLTSGLVGYWPMEENTGTTTADMSGNGNTGTLNNGATWTTGQIGNATNFDGANDFITLQDSPVFDFGGAGSFCHWFYSTTFQNGIGMFSQDVSGAPSHKWLTYITGSSSLLAIYVRISGTAYSAVGPSKTAGYYDNAWHHICGTFDKTLSSNRLKIYIDGNYAGASDAIAGDVDAGSYPSLGMWYGNSYFTGKLDEVRVYNRALSAEEVQQLYYNVRPAAAQIPSGKFQLGSGKLKFP